LQTYSTSMSKQIIWLTKLDLVVSYYEFCGFSKHIMVRMLSTVHTNTNILLHIIFLLLNLCWSDGFYWFFKFAISCRKNDVCVFFWNICPFREVGFAAKKNFIDEILCGESFLNQSKSQFECLTNHPEQALQEKIIVKGIKHKRYEFQLY
jgi:hypothetical protein